MQKRSRAAEEQSKKAEIRGEGCEGEERVEYAKDKIAMTTSPPLQ
jgi:hypothetical protein